MRNVESHLLGGKMDETVTHYITSHQPSEQQVHVDSSGLPLNVPDDGGGRVVTVMHQQGYPSHLCRQVSVAEPVPEGQWSEELLDTDTRLAALVAHLHHPTAHHKHTAVQSSRDVDTSVILDAPMRLFNGQTLDQQDNIVVEVPSLPPLPPLQEMKMRNQEADWFNNKTKTILKDDAPMLTDSDGPVLDIGAGASPAQNKQNKKSLPHKKRISKKLKRNNGSSTPQQQLVVINCSDEVQQEEILPDNFVASVQHQQHIQETHHITHEVRPIFICQICGDFYGEEQLKFFHHLKQHYEPHTIIIENPVPDLGIDKMTNTCIVDNVSTLPDSIMELSQSLENTVPKTMYQPMDKHILYTTSDKTLSYSNNKLQYSMASMDKEPAVLTSEAEKTDIYETLEKLELFSCVKCNKSFRKLKQCEAHIRDAHNTKLEDISEFSEPEDLMEGIHVAVDDGAEHYDHTLLPHLTVENGHVHQDHIRHWYMRTGGTGSPPPGAAPPCTGAYCPVCPAPQPAPASRDHQQDDEHLKEESVQNFQRIFDAEVPAAEASFAENILPESAAPPPAPPPPAEDAPKEDGKKKTQKRFECTQCGRVFLHRNSLMYHLLSHSGKQQVCRDCGKSFYTATALKIHRRVHSDSRPCKCEECGREFRQWSDLKYHKTSIHSNQKLFKCEFCAKEFARKYSLSLHRRIHTGERNYKCEYCNKSFRASSYRLSHMRTHTGDRPFKCNECDKCFRVAGDLRRHTLTHNKSRARLEDKAKNKQPDRKSPRNEHKMDIKIENVESISDKADPDPKNYKKVAVASTTTRLPATLKTDKKPRLKKTPATKKGAAPNVTVTKNDTFKIAENSDIEVFELRNFEHYKYKEVYSDPNVNKDYSEQIYKDSERMPDERDMFRNNLCDVVEKPPYRTENTDGKLQIFTHIEKTKDYSGPVISNPVSLGDIRHLERELAREVRSDTLHAENIENGFIDRLTALYNIPAV